MSDPAKTPEEIEDVLASVRRLVSDHSPQSTASGSTAKSDVADDDTASEALSETLPEAEPVAEPMPAEALVLTPSFRVTDPEDPWVPVAASEEGDTVVDLLSDDFVAEDLVAEIVTADAVDADDADEVDADEVEQSDTTADGDTDWQPDDRLASFDAVGEDAEDAPTAVEWVDDHSDTPSDEDIADLIRLDGSEAPVADFESETGDDNWPEGGAEAALLTLVARREPAAEAEDAAAAELDDDLLQENLRSDEDEGSHEDAVSDDVEVSETDNDDDDAAVEPDSADDDDSIETDEAATPEAEAFQEEPSVEDAPQAAPIFARQNVEGDAHATEDAPVEDLGDTPSPFTFPETEDGILDEDTLREIIVDVVREELQGVLGQRITRNVRKMVRREIRLALAAEDLE